MVYAYAIAGATAAAITAEKKLSDRRNKYEWMVHSDENNKKLLKRNLLTV